MQKFAAAKSQTKEEEVNFFFLVKKNSLKNK